LELDPPYRRDEVDTQGPSLRAVAVDMSPVNRVDSTGGGALPFLVVRDISN